MACEMSPTRAPGRDGDRGRQRSLGRGDHGGVLRGARAAHHEADGGVGDHAAQRERQVKRQQVAVSELVVVRQAVQHRVVHRPADVVAEGPAPERRRVVDVAGLGARLLDHRAGPPVEVEQVGADGGASPHGLQDLGHQGPASRPWRTCAGLRISIMGPSCATGQTASPE